VITNTKLIPKCLLDLIITDAASRIDFKLNLELVVFTQNVILFVIWYEVSTII